VGEHDAVSRHRQQDDALLPAWAICSSVIAASLAPNWTSPSVNCLIAKLPTG
jgi:hypothetical protein